MIFKYLKCLLVGFSLVLLTACEAGSNEKDTGPAPTISPTLAPAVAQTPIPTPTPAPTPVPKSEKEKVVEKLVNFIRTQENPLSVEDYIILGFTEVNAENLDAVNKKVLGLANAFTSNEDENVSNTFPSIKLVGAETIYIEAGSTYEELGASAHDNEDGNLTASIIINAEAVQTDTVGEYSVHYEVSDSDANRVVISRLIIVEAKRVNARPSAVAGPDVTISLGQSTLLDSRQSSDVDGNIVWLMWTIVGRTFALSHELTHRFTPRPGDAGSRLEVHLRVRDNEGAEAVDSMFINVQ